MARQEIGDFEGSYPTADYIDARNIRGDVISAQVIQLADVGGVIRTEDFETGSTGWAIFADGSAEFNDVVIRGQVIAGAGSVVDWSYINNVSITNADITNLTFDKIIAGTNTATLTLGSGGLLRTAASGERVEISNATNSQVRFFNSSGTNIGNIDATSTYLRIGNASNPVQIVPAPGNNINLAVLSGGQITLGNYVSFGSSSTLAFNSNTLTGVGAIRNSDGSASSPSFRFTSDGNTGIFRSGTDDMRLAAGGSSIAQVTSGRFGPGSDNNITLGGSGLRWQEIWMVGAIGSVNNVSRDASGRMTVASSSRRYKNNIWGISDDWGMDLINTLRPVEFSWNDDEKISVPFPDRRDIGLIAEEVAVIPGAERLVLLDDDDIPVSVRYDLLTVPLIAAVQQLSVALEEVSARLDAYEH